MEYPFICVQCGDAFSADEFLFEHQFCDHEEIMPIPNPHNGFIPKVGDRVRIVGACHPRALGKVVEVTNVDADGKGYSSMHFDPIHGDVYSGGELGGLEPAPGCDIDTF